MKVILSFILSRLSEASTWRGITSLLTSVGVALNPDQIGAIVTAGLGVIGLIGVFFPDSVKKTA